MKNLEEVEVKYRREAMLKKGMRTTNGPLPFRKLYLKGDFTS